MVVTFESVDDILCDHSNKKLYSVVMSCCAVTRIKKLSSLNLLAIESERFELVKACTLLYNTDMLQNQRHLPIK